MRIARALTIKATLPLFVAGATLFSGTAIVVPSAVAGVSSVPAASGVAHGAHLAMLYDGPGSKMLYD
jgi:hypothetical protein